MKRDSCGLARLSPAPLKKPHVKAQLAESTPQLCPHRCPHGEQPAFTSPGVGGANCARPTPPTPSITPPWPHTLDQYLPGMSVQLSVNLQSLGSAYLGVHSTVDELTSPMQ